MPLHFPKDKKWHKDRKALLGPLLFWNKKAKHMGIEWLQRKTTGVKEHSPVRTRDSGSPKPHCSVNRFGITFGRGSFSLYCWQTYHLSPNPLSLWSCCWNRLRSDLNQFGCDTGSQQKSCSLISGLVYLKPVFQCHGTTERTSTVTSHLVPLPPCILKKKIHKQKLEKQNKSHKTYRGCRTVQQECKYILFWQWIKNMKGQLRVEGMRRKSHSWKKEVTICWGLAVKVLKKLGPEKEQLSHCESYSSCTWLQTEAPYALTGRARWGVQWYRAAEPLCHVTARDVWLWQPAT